MAREIFDFVLTFSKYKYILISEVRKTQIKQSEVIVMKYTVDGRKVTERKVRRIEKKNRQILDDVMNGGDFSKLLNIEFLFGKEVEKACKANKK